MMMLTGIIITTTIMVTRMITLTDTIIIITTTIITVMITNMTSAFICRVGKGTLLRAVPTRRRLSQPSRQTLSTDRVLRVPRGHAAQERRFAHPTEESAFGAWQ
jgi:Co/Zn/Cd efflux system component